MSGKIEKSINMELIINILGIDVLKEKKHLNTSIPKDHLAGFLLKE